MPTVLAKIFFRCSLSRLISYLSSTSALAIHVFTDSLMPRFRALTSSGLLFFIYLILSSLLISVRTIFLVPSVEKSSMTRISSVEPIVLINYAKNHLYTFHHF